MSAAESALLLLPPSIPLSGEAFVAFWIKFSLMFAFEPSLSFNCIGSGMNNPPLVGLFESLRLRAAVSDFRGTGLSHACPIEGICASSSTGIWQTNQMVNWVLSKSMHTHLCKIQPTRLNSSSRSHNVSQIASAVRPQPSDPLKTPTLRISPYSSAIGGRQQRVCVQLA